MSDIANLIDEPIVNLTDPGRVPPEPEHSPVPTDPGTTDTLTAASAEPVQASAQADDARGPGRAQTVPQSQIEPTSSTSLKAGDPVKQHSDLLRQFRIATGDLDERASEPAEPAVVEPAPAQPVKPTAPAKPVSEARDYSDIAPQHKPLFERMSNEAFALAKQTYLERQQLQQRVKDLEAKTIPQSYYANPHAYVLTPEFREASQQVKTADYISSHWRQQLNNLRAGKQIQGLTQDDKGNLVPTQSFDAAEGHEAQIIEAITQAANYKSDATRRAEAIRDNFTAQIADVTTKVKQAEETYFPGFDKENHPAHKVMAALRNDIPQAFNDHPLTPVTLKAMAAVVLAAERINAMQKELTAAKNAQKDVTKAQPTVRAIGTGNAAGATKTFTRADYDKLMSELDL